MNPRRIQLLVRFGYDGSRFHGLQPQGALPTAGAALRARIEGAARQRARALCFAARTDAGVHALSNAATFWLERPLDVERFCAEVGAPRDDGLWRVIAGESAAFVHARGSSRGKRYRYRVVDGSAEQDLDERYVWRVVPRLDGERMREAAAHLVGEHDFSAFRAPRCSASSPQKRLVRLAVTGPLPTTGAQRLFFLEFAGDAFLRKMVRIIVGTLVEVGAGWRAPDDVKRVLAERDRSIAGITAPARGLVLMQVGMSWPLDGSGLIPELS